MPFSRIEDAIDAIARGEMIIVVDDEDRENEGDILIAADAVTPVAIAFMMKHARGLVCISMTDERLDELDMPLMVSRNSESMMTAFTVSVDVIAGTTSGISAGDRAATIRALVDPHATPLDFARPGHVFPLRANPQGVLGRQGHTEAAVDFTRLAGRSPSGVICEIANDDGSMARLPQLIEFAEAHGLLLVTIEDLIAYRRKNEQFVERIGLAEMPTRFGDFKAISYRDLNKGVEHIALIKGDCRKGTRVPVRVHSECLTGEVLGSLRCDCGEQLEMALSIINDEGAGCLIYLRGQEGRGIGLGKKIAAYGLQDQGLDTLEANRALGLPDDSRDYLAAASILRDLDIDDITLLTNSPAKLEAIQECGIKITGRRSLLAACKATNVSYLLTKKEKFGHFLDTAWTLEAG